MTTLTTPLTASDAQPGRLNSVDQLRGLALVLMGFFHFGYDLSLYGYVEYDNSAPFWAWSRFIIVTLFFTSVGISLVLANRTGIQWRTFWLREAKISAAAVVISLVTWYVYPSSWVWFGVLHFIAVASILTLPVLYRPHLALAVGLSMFVLFNTTTWFNLSWLHHLLKHPLNLPDHTLDLTRLIPWLGMVYVGVFLGHYRLFGLQALPRTGLNPMLGWLGRHSLSFYLLHQIPLFGLAWLIHWVFG